jgi:DNA ligase D-like protein (predicted 3'-phosphoesterase)
MKAAKRNPRTALPAARPASLKGYRAKRHFGRTPEPAPALTSRRGRRRQPIFVIQKHDATAMHYDFRMEAGAVLKSWAVPKGPSLNPRDKRLAMATEDHPMSYARFEGVIPEGQYGAGPVIVWDTGTYRNLTQSRGEEVPAEDAIARGHITFWLEGRKLRGGFALTRTGSKRGREKWLLVKMADEQSDARRRPVNSQPESVLSGRTIEGLARRSRRAR